MNNSYMHEIMADEQIVNSQTQQVKSHSESVLVAFDLDERKSFEVYPHWRARIEEHEGDLG